MKILLGKTRLLPDLGNSQVVKNYKKSIVQLEKTAELVKNILTEFGSCKSEFSFESYLSDDSFLINLFLVMRDVVGDQSKLDFENNSDDVLLAIKDHVKNSIKLASDAVKDLERTIIESPADQPKIKSKIRNLPKIVSVINKKNIEGSLEIFGDSYDIPAINNAIIDQASLSSSYVELKGVSKFETFYVVSYGLYAVTMKFKLLNSNIFVPKKCFIEKSLLLKILNESDNYKKPLGNYTLEHDDVKNIYTLKTFEFIQSMMIFDEL